MSNPADTYERYMVPVLFAPFAEHMLNVAFPQAGERLLDVACETGIVVRRAAARVQPTGSVSGIDINPNMLAVAGREAEREGLSIDWHEGRAEALPFADASFDLVTCHQALQFFSDAPAAIREMYRVLIDGGRVTLSTWQGIERHPFYQELDAAFQRRVGMSSVQDIFVLGDADTIRAWLATAGFRDVAVTPASHTARFPDPDSFLAGEIDVDAAAIPAMQHMSEQERRKLTAAISDNMREVMQQHTVDNTIAIPFHTNIVSGFR